MHQTFPRIPAKYIMPLNMNGLRGRMLRMPPPKNKSREVLLVYGHHATLERWYGFAEVLNDYAGVTMPDLPGFGGMDSLYKIGEKPDLDTMADYLASIVKLRFKNRRFTIAGISYGFLIATRMLQRYPEIAKKIDMVVSVAGFAHHEDFVFSKTNIKLFRLAARFLSWRLMAALFRKIALSRSVLRTTYHKTLNAKHKFEGYDENERRALTEAEIVLWHANEVRTHMATTYQMLTVDNCRAQVDLPVTHIGVDADHYFNNQIVEQHMRVIFNDFTYHKAPLDRHVPNILANKKESAKLFPRKIRSLLNKKD